MKPRLARHCNKAGNGTLPVRQSPPHKPGLLAKELHSVEKHLRTISLFGLRPNQEFPIWPSKRAHNAQMEPLQRIISVYKAHLGSLVHQLPSILKRFRAYVKTLHLPGRAEISSVMKGSKVSAARFGWSKILFVTLRCRSRVLS